MKIASFNCNGIRPRLNIVLNWLQKESPDVLCLQETKVQDADFPKQAFESIQYNCVFKGQKTYNGVAILSRIHLDDIQAGFGDGDASEEPRLIRGKINNIPIVNTYIPQGNFPLSKQFQYKLNWFERIRDYFVKNFDSNKPLLWVGDFNVAPEPIDVYDPGKLLGKIGYHPAEHKALQKVKAWGFEDVFRRHQQGPGYYTFWDYRVQNALAREMGWRVDHIWATRSLAEESVRAWIDVRPRLLEKPSDHTFIIAEFSFSG